MHKNAIITGANRGIGKSLVEVFAANSYNVWACCRKITPDVSAMFSVISHANDVEITPVELDLENDVSIETAVKLISTGRNTIDVLVNNAGVSSVGLLTNTKIDDVKKIFDVNFFGTLRMIQLVAKKMMLRRNGSIINIASIAGIEPQPGKVAYGSSKAALIMATKCLAKEFGPLGIRINAIAPGPVETEMIHQYDDEMLKKLEKESPLRRLGNPKEIAETAVFLASEKASYINGEIIRVDGGR